MMTEYYVKLALLILLVISSMFNIYYNVNLCINVLGFLGTVSLLEHKEKDL